MLVSVDDIQWGRYGGYEGPFFRGTSRYCAPAKMTEEDRIVAVITATEGGAYDAINMYDGQILSATLIQVTENKYYSVSDALGEAVTSDAGLFRYLDPALNLTETYFAKTPSGKWRFHWLASHEPVSGGLEQQQLMLGCSGLSGSWTPRAKELAKTWAACVASFWKQPSAQKAQIRFIVPRLHRYAFFRSKDFVEEAEELGTPEALAFVAAYLSFAVNNPSRAAIHLEKAMSHSTYERWSLFWLYDVLRELTFGPRISIYPHRYEAIRPVVERLFGVDLPDFSEELRLWDKEEEPRIGVRDAQQLGNCAILETKPDTQSRTT